MPLVSADAVRKQIEARTAGPVYVLTGPDEREKGELASRFAELVEPELRAFNVERLYGGESNASAVALVEAARTLPMMAPRRVVVLLQADRLLLPRRRGDDEENGAGDLEVLVEYLGAPLPETTLVLVLPPADPPPVGRGHALLPLNGNARITKALAKVAAIVPCGVFADETEVVRWLRQRAADAGVEIEPEAARRLVEGAGSDPAKLRSDMERVLTYAAGEPRLTAGHVEEAILAREISTDDWAIVRAIERGQAAAALRELRARLEAGDAPYAVLGQIGYAVRTPPPRGRFPEHRLAGAIDAIFRTDVALKTSGGDPRALLERLIVELCG